MKERRRKSTHTVLVNEGGGLSFVLDGFVMNVTIFNFLLYYLS